MHIVILGAGYAGVRVILEYDRLVRGRASPARLTLIDRNPYHQLVVLLHVTATAGITPEQTVVSLDRILAKKAVQLHQACVTRIEPLQRQVFLDDGTAVDYDRLVVALGSETAYQGVPGARAHGWPLRTLQEAVQLRNHIRARFAEAAQTNDPTERRILLTTAIVGGGYTGCQFAGEMADWAVTLAREVGVSHDEVRIALLERGGLLLKQLGPWATRETEKVLDRRRVSVYLNTKVERVAERAIYVAGNRVMRAGTIVWAAGVHAPALLAEAGLPVDECGRVRVDRYLRVQDQALIFAAGDSAHVTSAQLGVLPATASYALRQGEYLAQTLLDEAEGRAPRPYEPIRLGDVVSLGPGDGIGNPLGVRVFGQTAALLKQAVESWYQTTLV